jgi:hypothetical protein
MSPFRHLLSPRTAFEWTDELDEAFTASKEKIIELIQKGVYSVDAKLETCLNRTIPNKVWDGSCSRRPVDARRYQLGTA